MLTDQRRAKRAAQLIAMVGEGAKRKEYQALIKGLPALIHQAGLLQALAFLAAKAETDQPREDATEEHALALVHLAAMLADAKLATTDNSLVDQCAGKGLIEYARTSREAVAGLGWLKRLSVATWGELGRSSSAFTGNPR